MSYSVSSIAGYKEHLPRTRVTLPFRYPIDDQTKPPNDYFHSKLACSGNIINLRKGRSSFIEVIFFELLTDMRTLNLIPANLDDEHPSCELQYLEVVLPHEVYSGKTVNVHFEEAGESMQSEGVILVDMIDRNFLFTTLKFDLSDFVHSKDSKEKLSLTHFNNWGKISIPYSFELRSAPFFMKALDSLNIMISLKDGGLLHFRRLDHLSDFSIFNFTESNSILSTSFMSLFKRNSNLESSSGISLNSVVDMESLTKNNIVTLTVNKEIKVWNLKDHSRTHASFSLGSGNELKSQNTWYKFGAKKYLHLVENPESKKTFLTCYFPLLQASSGESGYNTKVWEICSSEKNTDLIELGHLSFVIDSPDNLLNTNKSDIRFQNAIWLIQGFECRFVHSNLYYNVLWKSNTSSVMVEYVQNLDNGSIVSITSSVPRVKDFLRDSLSYRDEEYFSNKILNSGRYDSLILLTSLNLLRESNKLEEVRTFELLRKSIIDSISKLADVQNLESKSTWYKLFSLCEEFKKASEESVCFNILDSSTIITLNVDGLSVFRPSHFYEKFNSLKLKDNAGQLAALIGNLNTFISPKTYNKICKALLDVKALSINASTAGELFDLYLQAKISGEEIVSIMSALDDIPEVLDAVHNLLDYNNASIQEHHSSAYVSTFGGSNNSDNDNTLLRLSASAAIRSIRDDHFFILQGLVAILLLSEPNDQILHLLNKTRQKLFAYTVTDMTFDISSEDSNSSNFPVKTGLNLAGTSLFFSGIVCKHPNLESLIQTGKTNEAFDYLNCVVLNASDNLLVDIIIELINHDKGIIIKDKFLEFLRGSSVVNVFLRGIVYLISNHPKEFYDIFVRYELFGSEEESTNSELKNKMTSSLKAHKHIHELADLIFNRKGHNSTFQKANYYHILAILSEAQSSSKSLSGDREFSLSALMLRTNEAAVKSSNLFTALGREYIEYALKFERKAIETLKGSSTEEGKTPEVSQCYLNMYTMALKLSDYDLIFESLSNLPPRGQSNYDYKELFARLITKLIFQQKIYIIFPPKRNMLLSKQYLLIDQILLELANEELILSNSLKYYEYLYSWRLFGASSSLQSNDITDKRSAAESLYMFITRFRNEYLSLLSSSGTMIEDFKQYKLKVLELYMLILNCLRTFEDDEDKWILKSKSKDMLTYITMEELNVEYFEWLKELKEELN